MAEDTIKLEVVTPLALALSTRVSYVAAPSVEGEFGVLEQHRPLLAALQHGRVQYLEKGKTKEAAVSPGFAEVGSDQVMLLVEKWVAAEDIDIDEARDDLARAGQRLRELEGQGLSAEYEEARRQEKWASVRIDVATRHRHA
jgi:F-type H+-transporting ATPase subunit epsilon